MNIQLTDYFLALAALSLSFVAFSTIVVALRQALGSRLTPFDILLVRFFIETGFIVTLFSLLPVMLNAIGLDTPLNWRLSSAMAVVLTFAYFWSYMQRRRHTPGSGPAPSYLRVNIALTLVAQIGLVSNAVGWPFHPGAAPYAIAFTWWLVQSGFGFLQTLHLFLEPSPADGP